MERAGFGIRLVATLIDLAIYGVISWLVNWALGDRIGFLADIVLAVIYYIVIPLRTNGQTYGKKITRIRIAKADEGSLTAWNLFLREFIGKFISSIILLIGYLMVLGRQKRALHDYVAGTVVLRVQP